MDRSSLDTALSLKQPIVSSSSWSRRSEQARLHLQNEGLPLFGSEDYQRTDLSTFFDGLMSLRLSMCTSNRQAFLSLDKAFFFGPFSEFAKEFPDKVSSLLSDKSPFSTDGYILLNEALSSDVCVLYVSEKQTLEEPIELSFSEQNPEQLGLRSLRILLEEQASAKLILRDLAGDHTAVLQHVSVCLGPGARLEVHEEVQAKETARRIATCWVEQRRDSMLSWSEYTLSCGLNRNNFYSKLFEPGAEVFLKGLALATKNRHIDNYAKIEHLAPHCHTDELFKYIVDDNGYGVFSGRIYVDQVAQKTLAYQNNRNLLLSGTGNMHSKPQLEIYADDVKCSHGMTTGQLSDEALFYLCQRGIPLAEARKMLVKAFAEEVIGHLDNDPSLLEELHSRIEAELN